MLSRIALIELDDEVVHIAASLAPPSLGSLNAVHLATALSLGKDLGALCAYDARLVGAELRAVGSMQGAAGSREGAVSLANLSDQACTLQGSPAITLLDQNLHPITSGVTFSSSPAGWVVNGSPQPAGWPVVTLQPGDSASVRLRWSNWCPDGRAAPLWRIGIPGSGTVDVNGLDAVSPPPCNGPGLPSTIEVGPFEPGAGP